MLTALLQLLVAVLIVAFAAVALAVGRRAATSAPSRRAAWTVAGAAFLFHGANMMAQAAFAVTALVAGPGEPAYRAYMAVAPAMNHSRTVALLAFFGTLLALPYVAERTRWFVPAAVAAVLLGAAAGAAGGVLDGRLGERSHYLSLVSLDSVELVFVLGVLFLLLVRDAVDRLLWLALAVYALSLALNILFVSPVGLRALVGGWAPPGWSMQAYRAVLRTAMLAIALRRWSAARRGTDVPALFEPLNRRATPPPPLLQ
jgi:hypothetical protein